MSHSKPQLRPWLIEQIESGRYQGLCWINEQRNTFRIPWKHASRHDLSEDDYRIFKDWAIVSGKFTSQDASDPPKWKTNFRCALNSNESFKKLADNSKVSLDPHKVYCIIDLKPSVAAAGADGLNGLPCKASGAAASDVQCGVVEVDEELESILFVSPETKHSQPDFTLLMDPDSQDRVEEVMPDFRLMSLSDAPAGHLDDVVVPQSFYSQPTDAPVIGHIPLGAPPLESSRTILTQAVPGDQRWEPEVVPGVMVNFGHEGPIDVQPAGPGPLLGAEGCLSALDQRWEPEVVPGVMVNFGHEGPIDDQPAGPGPLLGAEGCLSALVSSDLDVTIYYRGKEVLHTTVTSHVGCRLYFQEEDQRFADLQPVRFPSTDGLSDHKQRKFTDRILNSIEGGLLLWHRTGDVLAQRLGKCQVFWACSENGINHESQKLNRNEPTRIFCLKDFIQDMLSFMEREGGAPPCETYLCFGQQFLESSLRKKLILVKVVPKACVLLTEMAHQGGASSLDSDNVSLLISNSTSLDNLRQLLREIEDMEVDL
ncbi:interferon regulatory factor 7 isoform X2 [Narcine bancroftii]|uniref:interferon regulatory factor 7 isoform X2 n=1 Tax=Narcine bancroftii TaxID=1343680 RepID=UPI003831C66E